jgi:hypothetical protein
LSLECLFSNLSEKKWGIGFLAVMFALKSAHLETKLKTIPMTGARMQRLNNSAWKIYWSVRKKNLSLLSGAVQSGELRGLDYYAMHASSWET